MTFHNNISNKIVPYLNNIYYINKYNKIFVYLQYYFIYTFFYYITKNNIIIYSISLHLIYICELIFKNILIENNYKEENNTLFLINSSKSLFLYLFFFKIIFLKKYLYNKIFLILSIFIFHLLMNINNIYTKRLECIELNKEFYHPFKIIILSPNKDFITNIIHKTKYFTYSNFLIFVNLLFLIL